MTSNLCNILLISDNLGYTALIQGFLAESSRCSLAKGLDFGLTSVDSLFQALSLLQEKSFAVIIVDLLLQEERGIPTFVQLRENFANIPIIVQIKNSDEHLIVLSMQLGADGYICLEALDCNLLIYQVRLAIERQRYLAVLGERQQQKQQELEFRELEHLVGSRTSITARMFGSELLRESLPDLFAELVKHYGDLLDLCLEEKAYKVEHNISDKLRVLADKLGFLKASPRDVVEIHTTSIRKKNQEVTLAKAQAYVSEGRLLILELMGYLVSFYRKYYIGLNNIKLAPKSSSFNPHE
jgi:DNA-binding NarL/FixJ family response regulator